MNPCECGFQGIQGAMPLPPARCALSPPRVGRLLDRIDLRVELSPDARRALPRPHADGCARRRHILRRSLRVARRADTNARQVRTNAGRRRATDAYAPVRVTGQVLARRGRDRAPFSRSAASPTPSPTSTPATRSGRARRSRTRCARPCFEALLARCAQTASRRCTTPLGLVQWADRRSCYYAVCVRRSRHRQRIRRASSPLT